jgi:hypothetical protein
MATTRIGNNLPIKCFNANKNIVTLGSQKLGARMWLIAANEQNRLSRFAPMGIVVFVWPGRPAHRSSNMNAFPSGWCDNIGHRYSLTG